MPRPLWEWVIFPPAVPDNKRDFYYRLLVSQTFEITEIVKRAQSGATNTELSLTRKTLLLTDSLGLPCENYHYVFARDRSAAKSQQQVAGKLEHAAFPVRNSTQCCDYCLGVKFEGQIGEAIGP